MLDINLGMENSFPIARLLEKTGTPFLFATGYNFGDVPTRLAHVPTTIKPFDIASSKFALQTYYGQDHQPFE